MAERLRAFVPLFVGVALGCTPESELDRDESESTSGASESTGGHEEIEPLPPVLGEGTTVAVDCMGSYTLPNALVGEDGLAHHGWTLDDLTFTGHWPVGSDFSNAWLSDDQDTSPSLRVHPEHVPDAGACYRAALQNRADAPTDQILRATSAFTHREYAFDELASDQYAAPSYRLESPLVLTRALRGLIELPNSLPGAPTGAEWSDELATELVDATAGFPVELEQAIADLVLALGEAHMLKIRALAAHPLEEWRRIHDQFLLENYGTVQNTFVSPTGGSIVLDMKTMAADFEVGPMNLAAQRLTSAADRVQRVAESVGPFDSPGLDVATPHGRILISTGAENDDWDVATLAGTALVLDLGGNDNYEGQFATTAVSFGLGAGVLIDVGGDDVYGVGTPDIEDHGTSAAEAFAVQYGFSQGMGLFGVGLLMDGSGDDTYAASVYAQGSGAFGVGVVDDRGGHDDYQLGYFGQGAGYFGSGLLIERGGDDRYGTYTMGQGLGKPAGHGLLFDVSGADSYIGYYEADEPYLPGPGYPNYYDLGPSWAYGRDGVPHFMSLVQGVGWGYRGDWGLTNNWMGGFGALVDLGDDPDEHFADTFSMGQGFIYGFGFLYDEGGDDSYHSFWWGPAAAAHMGIALMWDEAGDDEVFVTRASGGFGFDWSVAWLIDNAGDDVYGGQMHLGEGYTWGQGFFINVGGDDIYNLQNDLTSLGASARYGHVRTGRPNVKLVGAFLDLGGGNDQYNTDLPEIGNDRVWHLEPTGEDADPELHKGIGIDE